MTRVEQSEQLSLSSMKLSAPLNASAGHELILAHLPETSTQPGLPNYTGDAQSHAKAVVLVDGKERTLPDPHTSRLPRAATTAEFSGQVQLR